MQAARAIDMFPEGKSIIKNIQGVFHKQPEPKELVRKWQGMLRKETRNMDIQIRDIQREEKSAKKQIKDAAKRGDIVSARVIAREVARSHKTVTHLYTNKAHMIAMGTQLQEQMAMVRVAGTLSKSTEVMKLVNDMMKGSQLNAAMIEMSREMMKAGIIDEMVSEAIDSAVDDDDADEETEAEVEKVLQEIAGDTMAEMATVPNPQQPERQDEVQNAEEEGDYREEDDLMARLAAVRS